MGWPTAAVSRFVQAAVAGGVRGTRHHDAGVREPARSPSARALDGAWGAGILAAAWPCGGAATPGLPLPFVPAGREVYEVATEDVPQ